MSNFAESEIVGTKGNPSGLLEGVAGEAQLPSVHGQALPRRAPSVLAAYGL